MALSVRKKRYLRRLLGYLTNPIAVKYRTLRHREQHQLIGGIQIALPPDHNLPFYQRRDPTYDAYAIGLLGQLAKGAKPVTVIDIGANVGDTAAHVLAASERSKVLSVEGDPHFITYWHRNLDRFPDRARLVEGFVGPIGGGVTYSRTGSTGGFGSHLEQGRQVIEKWVMPSDLLSSVDPDDLVVWKSDTDGFDIHILADNWEAISRRCDVIWFEFDPPGTLGDPQDIDRLISALAGSDRTQLVYDNLGRRIVELPPGDANGIRALTAWIHQQRSGHVAVPYLDIWAVSPSAAALLGVEQSQK